MAEKRRYTVTIPDHVASRIEANAKIVSASPTEYVADVVRWWFGQGCPPITPDEKRLRGLVDVWNLDPAAMYLLDGDDVVNGLLRQLGVPNLFAPAAEHDECHSLIAFDNHPTHWVILHLWKGLPQQDKNGLMFEAYPKIATSNKEISLKLQQHATDMGIDGPIAFSQIPPTAATKETLSRPAVAR